MPTLDPANPYDPANFEESNETPDEVLEEGADDPDNEPDPENFTPDFAKS